MDFRLSLPSPRWGGAPAAATGAGVANTGRRAPAEMPGGSGWGPGGGGPGWKHMANNITDKHPMETPNIYGANIWKHPMIWKILKFNGLV